MTPADASDVAALFTVKRAVHAARRANKTTFACNPHILSPIRCQAYAYVFFTVKTDTVVACRSSMQHLRLNVVEGVHRRTGGRKGEGGGGEIGKGMRKEKGAKPPFLYAPSDFL